MKLFLILFAIFCFSTTAKASDFAKSFCTGSVLSKEKVAPYFSLDKNESKLFGQWQFRSFAKKCDMFGCTKWIETRDTVYRKWTPNHGYMDLLVGRRGHRFTMLKSNVRKNVSGKIIFAVRRPTSDRIMGHVEEFIGDRVMDHTYKFNLLLGSKGFHPIDMVLKLKPKHAMARVSDAGSLSNNCAYYEAVHSNSQKTLLVKTVVYGRF